MRFIILLLCFMTGTLLSQTTQPTTIESKPNSEGETLISKKLKELKEKKIAEEAEEKKKYSTPQTQPANQNYKPKQDTPESMLSEKERMAKFGLADSKKNSLGGIMPGENAPNFKGVDQNGNTIELKELLKEGEVVVIFYRGYWCGICNKQLADLESKLKTLTDKGAKVVAITTESNEFAKKTIEKNNISFSVISDKDGKIARDYKVLYEASEAYQKRVSAYTKSSLQKFNDSKEAFLPVPATYVIGQNEKINWRFYSIDYTERASVERIAKYLNIFENKGE